MSLYTPSVFRSCACYDYGDYITPTKRLAWLNQPLHDDVRHSSSGFSKIALLTGSCIQSLQVDIAVRPGPRGAARPYRPSRWAEQSDESEGKWSSAPASSCSQKYSPGTTRGSKSCSQKYSPVCTSSLHSFIVWFETSNGCLDIDASYALRRSLWLGRLVRKGLLRLVPRFIS